MSEQTFNGTSSHPVDPIYPHPNPHPNGATYVESDETLLSVYALLQERLHQRIGVAKHLRHIDRDINCCRQLIRDVTAANEAPPLLRRRDGALCKLCFDQRVSTGRQVCRDCFNRRRRVSYNKPLHEIVCKRCQQPCMVTGRRRMCTTCYNTQKRDVMSAGMKAFHQRNRVHQELRIAKKA